MANVSIIKALDPDTEEVTAYDINDAAAAHNTATGENALALGDSEASGSYSTALGDGATASGNYSAALGYGATASGDYSMALGHGATASGEHSYAEGHMTNAASDNQHVTGMYNIEDADAEFIEIVGNGTEEEASNARTLDWEGNETVTGYFISTNANLGIRHIHPTGTGAVGFGVGSGGINRGVYDSTNARWLIYSNTNNSTYIQAQDGIYSVVADGVARMRHIDCGSVSISGGSGSIKSKSVTFNVTFESTPYVFVTAIGSSISNLQAVTVYDRSTTGCTIYMLSNGSGSFTIQWAAIGYIS